MMGQTRERQTPPPLAISCHLIMVCFLGQKAGMLG